MAVDENQSMKFCRFCGKVMRSGRVGTMTSWIFGGNPCNCASPNSSNPSSIPLTDQAPLFDNVNKPVVPPVAGTGSNTTATTSAPLPDLGERFAIRELIGEGGMGTVYKIEELKTGKAFAAKVLKAELARDPVAIKRFEQEVQAAGELTHQNLVFIYGASHARDGTPYMVMNYVDGTNLSELLRAAEVLTPGRAVPIFIQIAEALAHVHSKGIVHRDLKPSNILIYQHETLKDAVRLVDFGIAKQASQGSTSSLTQTGELFGSPLYMSPEQCLGEPLDARSDIYSLGCVMYQTLCGQPPFNETNALKAMIAHMQIKPRPFRSVNKNLDISGKLESVVMRCLQKDAGKRYQSASDLLLDLEPVRAEGGSGLTGLKFWRQRVFLVALLGMFVTGIAAFWYHAQRALDASSATNHRNHVREPMYERPLKSTATADLIRGMLKKRPEKVSLARLYLCTDAPTDADLSQLKNVTYVKELDLTNTSITDVGLRTVATLPNLETLIMSSQLVEDWKPLQQMRALKTLDLTKAGLDADAMIVLGQLTNLESLNLSQTTISDLDLQHLLQLKNLKKLVLVKCPNLTPEGPRKLQDKLPNCTVLTH